LGGKASLNKRPFCHYENISEKNNLREERFLLADGFRGFSPLSAGSIVSGPVVRQDMMAEGPWWSRAAHLVAARKWRVMGRGPGHAPSDLLLSLPISGHLSIGHRITNPSSD
jgi:hypothetical protein